MHCDDPGCLKACPAPGAIVQYANGIVDFHQENCIGCGYCVTGCPFNIPRISQGGQQGLQVHAVLRPRRRRPGAGLRQDLPDRRDRVRHQGGDDGLRREAHRRPEGARLREGGALRPAGRRRHARHVRAAACRPAGALQRPARTIPASARWCRCGRASPSRWPRVAHGWRRARQPLPLRHKGPNEVSKELEDELEKEDAQ